MGFVGYVIDNWGYLLELAWAHLLVVLIAVGIGAGVGLTLGVLTFRHRRLRGLVIGASGLILTVPSLALYALFVGVFGLGVLSVIVALTLYSLLPIVRNTVTGLLVVDPAVAEAAEGMGMGRWHRLAQVELPLAWPVILTGIRVSTVVLVGIATLGAIVNGPGLGQIIIEGLRRVGSPFALDMALAGTLGVAVLGVLLDVLFSLIARLTTPRGIRD